jgi:hypothetical protein
LGCECECELEGFRGFYLCLFVFIVEEAIGKKVTSFIIHIQKKYFEIYGMLP